MRTILGFFICGWLAAPAWGQIDPLDPNANKSGWEQDAYMVDSLVEVHNALKLDPLQVLRGEIPLFYERRISNHISVEVGAGVTRRNWTYALFNVDADDLRRNITVKTGPTARLGLRYYFKDSPELDGLYVMPQAAYRIYEKEYAELDSAGDLNGVEHIDRREVGEVNLTIGFQKLAYSSNFLFDVYIGLGYAWRRGTEVFRREAPVQTLFRSEPLNNDGLVPVIGFKLGWGF